MKEDKLKTKQNFLKRLLLTKKSVFFSIGIFLISFLIGLILGLNLHIFPQRILDKQFRLSENYKFTNPLLDCEVSQNIGESEYKPSRIKIEDLINEKINNGKINYAAVYFRDLNNGPWFGINEQEHFAPASLLKLPVMIAFLKQIESNPSFANKEVIFEEEPLKDRVKQNFAPEKELTVEQKYTISDLIYRMIVYSDNKSLDLLGQNIDQSKIEKVIKDLGIEYLASSEYPDYISVKSYATLFRVLYNSSYLNRDSSEKALEILSKSEFDKGILQGVPVNTTVAHKFGEREISGQIKQLHDCGIVYYPKHPYLLCIMTKGQDWNELSNVIEEISKEIYTDVDKKNTRE